MKCRYAWVAWEHQRRSIELANALGANLQIFENHGYCRYLKSIFQTWFYLLEYRPDVLIVQNPSMVLAFFSVLIISPVLQIPVVVDRHSNFLLIKQKRLWIKEWLFNFMSYITIRYAKLTIVTNEELAHVINVLGGKAFILPDKIPNIKCSRGELPDLKEILVISSFAEDEPIKEIVAAFRLDVLKEYSARITGNYKKINIPIDNIPTNITFTGFLPEKDYINLLCSANVIMVLTKMEYTLLCGCYEAIAVDKPLITSDTFALKKYFFGAKFVEPQPASIAEGIIHTFADLKEYKRKTLYMKEKLNESWKSKFFDLKNILSDIGKL